MCKDCVTKKYTNVLAIYFYCNSTVLFIYDLNPNWFATQHAVVMGANFLLGECGNNWWGLVLTNY